MFQPNHQTLESSFSAVSAPIFALKQSFCSVCRDLQDCHTFAPFETENLNKNSSNFFAFFCKFSVKISYFSIVFVFGEERRIFFAENLQKSENACRFLLKFSVSSGAKVWQSCRSRQMLQNEYLLLSTIYLQRLVPIQRRTSPLKFDDGLAEKSE